MTEDTIFDLASLSKSIATTTAFMQLYEQGKVNFDDPVQTYLPDFNPTNDPRRARVTVRMLLTHTSGIAGDLSLDGPWGLDKADKAEGIHRALGAWVVYEPGAALSLLRHQLHSGRHDHRTDHRPAPGSDTCRTTSSHRSGCQKPTIFPQPKPVARTRSGEPRSPSTRSAPKVNDCPDGTWSTDLLSRIAPTALDEDTPGINPDYGHPLRGTVHDPTARRMGGVAGSAGVFSTVNDVGRFAQALLDRLAGRPEHVSAEAINR